MDLTVTAILLGIVEGVTEFIPVSSTGHLILASELFGYDAKTWEVFNIVIQLGAILAVVVLYWRTFWAVAVGLVRREAVSWAFVRNLLIAFLPAAVLGVLFKHQIDALLESPAPVGWALLLGGIAILAIERVARPGGPSGIGQLPAKTALGVGLVQCISMVPGVSRSGATIMGALAMGVERRTAAEFSFFLAVPTMLGASTLTLLKDHDQLGAVGLGGIALGFLVSFLVAVVVIKWFIGIVSRRGFAPFAWYRILVGAAAIVWLALR